VRVFYVYNEAELAQQEPFVLDQIVLEVIVPLPS
jgi:hypothetical protein